MRLAVVGGLDRHERRLKDLAEGAGHELETHDGHASSRSTAELHAMVERAEVVILVTSVTSHGAMGVAKKAANRLGRRLLVERTCGPARFSELLRALPAAP